MTTEQMKEVHQALCRVSDLVYVARESARLGLEGSLRDALRESTDQVAEANALFARVSS